MNRKTFSQLKEFSYFLRPYWRKGVLAGLLMAMIALLNLPVPLLTAYIIDKVIGERNGQLLDLIILLLLFITIIYISLDYLKSYLLLWLRKKVVNDVRLRVFSHVLALPIQFVQSKGNGYVMCQVRDDPNSLDGLLMDTVLGFVQSLLTFLVGIIAIFSIDWKLATVSVLVLPFFIFSNTMLLEKIKQANKEVREKASRSMKSLQESLSAILITKAFNNENYEFDKLAGIFGSEIESQLKAFVLDNRASRLRNFVAAMGPLIVVWYGGHQIMNGNLTIGNMVAFSSLLTYLYGPTRSLLGIRVSIQRSLASLERILGVLHTKTDARRDTGSKRVEKLTGSVRFDHVSFEYMPGKKILEDVSFEIQSGETTAIAGSFGSGKTTVLNLLMRFYSPTSGSIYVDGCDIKELDLPSLRKNIGYLPQEPFLFSNTIMENIRYGSDTATYGDIIEAAKIANAYTFIDELPQGFQTLVDERGGNLSGGQRQMICLARAILKNPQILILDEPTASIDSNSEKLIQESISRFARNRTVIIVSHRLSTAQYADVILRLQEGKVVTESKLERVIRQD